MWEDEFSSRLAQLRVSDGISAKDMSLAIGQNAGYINNIENGKSLPSMSSFLFICGYLGITPAELFDTGSHNPSQLRDVINNLKHLTCEQLNCIEIIVRDLTIQKKHHFWMASLFDIVIKDNIKRRIF